MLNNNHFFAVGILIILNKNFNQSAQAFFPLIEPKFVWEKTMYRILVVDVQFNSEFSQFYWPIKGQKVSKEFYLVLISSNNRIKILSWFCPGQVIGLRDFLTFRISFTRLFTYLVLSKLRICILFASSNTQF